MLNDSTVSKPTFNKVEDQIMAARALGVSVSEINGDDLKDAIDTMIFRACSICGGDLPRHERLADVLNDECGNFIKEFGYGNLTFSEIMLAFRMNEKGFPNYGDGSTSTVPYFGAHFNVHFMSQVLSAYMKIRDIIDAKIKNKIDEQ